MKGYLWAAAVTLVCGAAAAQPGPAVPEKPAVENLADNPGFEARATGATHLPAKWDPFSSGQKLMVALIDATKRSGERSLRMGTVGRKGAFVGMLQQREIDPKARYEFRAWVLDDANDRLQGGSEFLLSMEWLDEDGVEIGRHESRVLRAGLSKTQWKEVEVVAKPSKGATRAKFTLMLREDGQPGTGSLFVDDVAVVAK